MCTVLLAYRSIPGWPTFLAANRDEFFERESSPPRVQHIGGVRIVAPRDRRAGGTWVGLNDRGIAAVITNRSDLSDQDPPEARSRGLLVQRILSCPDLEAAHAFMARDAQVDSAPYNLLYGTHEAWFCCSRSSRGSAEPIPLEPGLHVVSNHGRAGDDSVGEVRRVHREWRERFHGDPWETARTVLSLSKTEHGLPPPLKTGHPDRGTRSSSIIGIDGEGRSCYLHADGPPNITDYVEINTP